MRLPDWEARLSDYLTGCEAMPFRWGKHDCCHFAAGAVAAMTGDDPIVVERKQYRGAVGAAKMLKTRPLDLRMNDKFERIPPAFGQRGDLAFYDDAVGVVIGADALFVTDDGLTRVARADWSACWRVAR